MIPLIQVVANSGRQDIGYGPICLCNSIVLYGYIEYAEVLLCSRPCVPNTQGMLVARPYLASCLLNLGLMSHLNKGMIQAEW